MSITADAPQIGQQSTSNQEEANKEYLDALSYLNQSAASGTALSAAMNRLSVLFEASSATTTGGDTTELADLATVASAAGGQCDPAPPSTAAQVAVAWAVISGSRTNPTCFDVTNVVVSTVDSGYAKATMTPDSSGEQPSCKSSAEDVLLDVSSSRQWQVVSTTPTPACGDAPSAVLTDLYGAAACPS
jgi:hypothetical protein